MNPIDPGKRWEQGIDHHPKSEELMRHMAKVDFEYGDALQLDIGGDGDIGESLMYLMDSFFEAQDAENNATT